MSKYDDMIDLPHHVSTAHPPMPLSARAAQFSPFAALTGYGEVIREAGRITEGRAELEEDARGMLDEKLRILQEPAAAGTEISVTYFLPDAGKEGGAYVTVTGSIKKADTYERRLIMKDGTQIPFEEIVGMEGEIFSALL